MNAPLASEWRLKDSDYDLALGLARNLRIGLTVAEICVGRGLNTPERIRAFTQMDLSMLHDPWGLPDMEIAVDRLEAAIRGGETVTLWGDYDVDGVTSTAIVKICFDMFGGKLDYHVPHRMIDGYDVKPKAVDIAVKNGSSLLVSVDCGIRAFRTAEYAKERGVDLIVTDHHHPSDDGRIPECFAVVNPARFDSTYPFSGLVGAGVALKVMQALAERLGHDPKEVLEMCLPLAAMGTVADVGHMADENRILAHHGCIALNNTKMPGLKALVDLSRASVVDTQTIGFQLGPRINAVGRIGDSREALECVLEKHPREAERMAKGLDTWNERRKRLQDEYMDQAYAMAEEVPSGPTIMVLAKDDWHIGLVGLIAGRVAEARAVPVLAIGEFSDPTTGELVAKGSCRSTRDYDILSALTQPDIYRLFLSCGGHKFAAGFSLPKENLPELREKLHEHALQTMGAPARTIEIDAIATPQDISLTTIEQLKTLAPFGNGHSEPTLMSVGMRVKEVKTMKDGKHLKLILSSRDGHGRYDAVMWQKGARASEVEVGGCVDVAYKLSQNNFAGRTSAQMLLEDFRPATSTD
jgi:single-stranded-DNA-specific exonuclease